MNASAGPADIRPDHLAIVQDILRAHLPADFKIWVFGSRAMWMTKDYSDLDLAIEGPSRLDHSTMVALKFALEESDLPYTVDVIDLNDAKETFRTRVEESKVPLLLASIEPSLAKVSSGATLQDYAEIVMGQSPPGSTVSAEYGVPLLNGPTEFGSHHPTPRQFTSDPRRRARAGDILFCVRGSTGRMNWADQEYAIGRGIAAIRHRFGGDLQPFLRGLIEAELPEILTRTTGSVFSNVSASQLAELPCPEFGEIEQRAIAHVLGTLDDKIELNRRMNRTLEDMAQAIFKDWFVDFGPTRAKLEGRDPYLPPDLWSLFPDHLVDSELGPIPEGWKVGSLGDIANFPVRTVSPSSVSGETPYFGLEHMPRRSIALAKWGCASTVTSNKLALKEGEFLFGKLRPYFHKVGVATVGGICSTDIIVVTPVAEVWSSIVLLLISSDGFVAYANQTSTGTRMPRTNYKTMEKFEFGLPTEQIAKAFQGIVGSLIDRIGAHVHESRALAAARDALLPRLLSGQVCVAGFLPAGESAVGSSGSTDLDQIRLR